MDTPPRKDVKDLKQFENKDLVIFEGEEYLVIDNYDNERVYARILPFHRPEDGSIGVYRDSLEKVI